VSPFNERVAGNRFEESKVPVADIGRKTETLCPLCRSREIRWVKSIDVAPVVALWREFFQIDIRPEFQGVSQMELFRCAGCSISFFTPLYLAGSPQMYSQLANHGGYYLAQKWEYHAALADLRGRERILEIGCGSGNFMQLAKEKEGLSIEGVEQNAEAIREAARRGFHVRETTIEDAAKESPGVYDAICAFQVFEHIAKPREFLDACCRLLRPKGLLILGVPNQNSYVRHMINPLDMPPHHMTRWTEEPLRRLQSHFPLRLVRTACEPLPDNQIEMYFDTYSRVLLGRAMGFVVHPWVRTQTIRLIQRFKIGRFIRGQNIYACYVRN
jgi:2-polyprenyl-3-methyl-5-hydroxy-6-metoxy-1,4-benzoquinol methylase